MSSLLEIPGCPGSETAPKYYGKRETWTLEWNRFGKNLDSVSKATSKRGFIQGVKAEGFNHQANEFKPTHANPPYLLLVLACPALLITSGKPKRSRSLCLAPKNRALKGRKGSRFVMVRSRQAGSAGLSDFHRRSNQHFPTGHIQGTKTLNKNRNWMRQTLISRGK